MYEKVTLESVQTSGRVVQGVTTNRGDIRCDVFVNCGGQVCSIFLLCELLFCGTDKLRGGNVISKKAQNLDVTKYRVTFCTKCSCSF